MMAYWNNLQQREKIWLSFTAVGLLVLFIYLQFIEPFYINKKYLGEQVVEGQELLKWMKQASYEVKQLKGNNGNSSDGYTGSLLTLVDSSSRKSGLAEAVDRIQPDGKRVQVWFKAVSFDQLIKWIGSLKQKHQISVNTAVIDKGERSGLVDVRLVLGQDK